MSITGPPVTDVKISQQMADACRYTPKGHRNFESERGAYFGDFRSGPDYMNHVNNILVIAQLEDVQVLDHLDDIPAGAGIDLFASGPQDITQSIGLPWQPTHDRVQEFEHRVSGTVHAAGRKMVEDVMANSRVTNLYLDGARSFLKSQNP